MGLSGTDSDDSAADSDYEIENHLPPSESDSEVEGFTPNQVVSSTPVSTTTSQTPQAPDQHEATPLTRKRKRQPATWKHKRKSAEYNSGRVRSRNGQKRARIIGPRCDCKKKCCRTISDEERKSIMEQFWGLGDALLRQNFILAHAIKTPKKRAKPDSKRGNPVNYYLTNSAGNRVAVCEKFFITTLDISRRSIHYNMEKSVHGIRKKAVYSAPSNKTPDLVTDSVRAHIDSINRIESHYSRSTTKREYFEAGLSIPKLYRMYRESPHYNQRVKESYYAKVFTENYNIGFHIPKKDTCDTCSSFAKMDATEMSDDMKLKQEEHNTRKEAARNHKENDKKPMPAKIAISFDLQQVLTAPRLFNGASYYKRKLNCYNLTVYELQTGRGFCYTWHEGEGARGTNEIASCVAKYLERIDEEGYSHVVMYSDTCGGQNRNKIFSTAIIHFLSVAKNVSKIEHKYFESGHSQMECDSMHSAIEKAFKNREVDLPCGYIEHMKSARSKSPYNVYEVTHADIKDFKTLNEAAFRADAFSGIIHAHYFMYEKTATDPTVSMSASVDGNLESISYRKRGGRQSLKLVANAYAESIKISRDKKTDLLSLVPHLSAKQMGSLFYNSLQTAE